MVIDIASLDLKERPVLALENLDETPIAILGNAFNIEAHIAYNETSSITFDLPAYANGEKTQGYDEVIGTRLIRFEGWGVFILVNPETTGDGIREIKSCKAYSREYELTYKKMSLEENTYNLWNPAAPGGTIMGIVLSYLPYWTLGDVDPGLIGKYRTFSENYVNIYNFLKSTVQTKYGCIVDFDTVNRRINLRSTANHAETKPVFLSLNNLAKEIEREEDTENIFTCLDVNGADGVTIRGVNPTGTNKIYNLDYYMNTSHFSQSLINKWTAWKNAFNAVQDEYYLLTIERMLKTSEITFEQSKIDDTGNADLKALEAQQSVYIELLARSDPSSDAYRRANIMLNGGTWQGQYYSGINNDIAAKESELAVIRTGVSALEAEKAVLTGQLQTINRRLAFETFPAGDSPTDDPDDPNFRPMFTAEEILLLKQYFKEDSISDSSFVYAEAKNYGGKDETSAITANSEIKIEGPSVEVLNPSSGNTIVKSAGGSVAIGNNLEAAVIKSTAQFSSSGHLVFTAYLSAGTLNGVYFPNGCLTAVTNGSRMREYTIEGVHGVSFRNGNGMMFFTRNTTAYEKYAVEWDLYEYGRDCLEKLAYPSYSFSVDTANFLSLDAFETFKNQLTLGQKVYIDMDDGNVLTPIFIGFEIEFEDPSSLKLEFGDKYCLKDAAFELADLLDKSVSMGKTVDVSRFGYNAFIDSGASTAVKDYMDAALDVSKQAIVSSGDIAISWDESGLKLRKWNQNHTDYEPEQIAMINNNIVFTDDAWASAKMAIGHFKDKLDIAKDEEEPGVPHESWGIVAPNIVGTLLAGENLVIESTKPDGTHMAFKVDGDGAVLYNSKMDIVRANTVAPGVTPTETHILLDPEVGFGIGTYPLKDVQTGTWDEDNAKFWVDMSGNVRMNNGYIDIRRDNDVSGKTQILIDPEHGFGIGTYPVISNGSWNTSNAKFYVDTGGKVHITGTLDAADGNFTGDISGANGTFTGIVKASEYQDSNGSNMFTDNKFGADWLNLKGITITDNNHVTTFSVDLNGNVTINGNVTMGAGSSISWSQVNGRPDMDDYTENGDFNNPNTAAGAVKSTADTANTTADGAALIAEKIAHGEYDGTTLGGRTYTNTFIEGNKIFSPLIYANTFTAIASDVNAESGQGAFVMRRGSDTGDVAFQIYYWYNQGWEAHIATEGSLVIENYTRFFDGATFSDGDVSIYGQLTVGINGNEDTAPAKFYGHIILKYGQTFCGRVEDLPDSAEAGQLYFVLD